MIIDMLATMAFFQERAEMQRPKICLGYKVFRHSRINVAVHLASSPGKFRFPSQPPIPQIGFPSSLLFSSLQLVAIRQSPTTQQSGSALSSVVMKLAGPSRSLFWHIPNRTRPEQERPRHTAPRYKRSLPPPVLSNSCP